MILLAFAVINSQAFAQASGNYNYDNRSGQQQVQEEANGNYNYNDLKINAAKSNSAYANNGYYTTNTRKLTASGTPDFAAKIVAENMMIFEVSGLYNAQADAYTAIFNVVQVAEKAKETDDLMGQRLAKFVTALRGIGLSDSDIFTDMISFIPLYEYKEGEKRIFSPTTYVETPTGFELQKNVHIKFTKGPQLDQIVSLAAQCEIYDLVKVEYFVNDTEKIYNTLREKSIAHLKKKIVDLSQLGIKFDTIYHVVAENKTATYPAERYQKYQAFSSQSLEAAKKQAVTTRVRKPISMFYNKLPYNDYDIVVNPSILEPAVQFSYNIKIEYIIKESQKVQKQYFYISPTNGSVQFIDLK